jgi:hypothetical protein
MTLSLSGEVKIGWTYQGTPALDLSTPRDQGQVNPKINITAGTGQNQGDILFHDRRTIQAPSQNDDIDLVGGVNDFRGNATAYADIRGLLISNLGVIEDGVFVPTLGEDLLVGGAGSLNNAWNQLFNGDSDAQMPVHSGGQLYLTAPLDGIVITGGSSDVLRIVGNGSGSNTLYYDIIVWGSST